MTGLRTRQPRTAPTATGTEAASSEFCKAAASPRQHTSGSGVAKEIGECETCQETAKRNLERRDNIPALVVVFLVLPLVLWALFRQPNVSLLPLVSCAAAVWFANDCDGVYLCRSNNVV